MKTYRIEVTEHAASQIDSRVLSIQSDSGSIEAGHRWSESVYRQIDSLRTLPDRYELAPEQVFVDYPVRRLLIGKYLAVYHVNESKQVVNVLAFRHGAQLPLRANLPDDPDG